MTKDIDFPPGAPPPPAAPSAWGSIEDPRRPVIAWTGTLESGFANEPHAHPRAQLALCYAGLARLRVGEDDWFAPARHGVWIPAGLRHQLTAQTRVELHNLFVDARFSARRGLPDRPTVVRATPLLRGVAQRLAAPTQAASRPAEMRRLAWVAIDEMTRLEQPDLRLPGGRDPRVVAAMRRLIADPGDRLDAAHIARQAGASDRTLARLFVRETGLTLRDWRSRLRFMLALEGLQLGETSASLAARLGYSTPSAFIAAFRKHFGAPPSAYRKPDGAPRLTTAERYRSDAE